MVPLEVSPAISSLRSDLSLLAILIAFGFLALAYSPSHRGEA